MAKTKESTIEEEVKFTPRRKSNTAPWILLLIVIVAGGVFAYMQTQKGKKLEKELTELKQNPQKASEEETKVLLDKVGQLVELPAEQPTVATVTDLAPLKEQPFFANAQVGDKVLIFSSSKKAILYRPSTNKVIEIAPVNLDDTPANVNTNTKATTNTNKNTDTKATNTNKEEN